MITKTDLAKDWLPRYTGTPLDAFGDHILLTNFDNYVKKFATMFNCDVEGEGRPMQTATNSDGITIINFGIGSASAATIIDLLTVKSPNSVLFLGKCGGLKRSTDLGHFILPSAAVRGEGTGNDYMPPELPALPAFEIQKFASEQVAAHGQDYRTGVVYTTNRRVWEWDEKFKIIINTTDHSSNPTVNAKIGSDAPAVIATISDNDALEAVAFTSVNATDDENDVTNTEGSDPGPNTINIPIAIAKQSGKDIVLKYSIDNVINYPSASDFYYDPTYARNYIHGSWTNT